ncbi:MAG: hypothetical protein ACKVU0_09385 [Saprospiraceae bacterium]
MPCRFPPAGLFCTLERRSGEPYIPEQRSGVHLPNYQHRNIHRVPHRSHRGAEDQIFKRFVLNYQLLPVLNPRFLSFLWSF